MHRSIRLLMERMIDYAGLFPPATLPMDATVRNYGQYVRGDRAWMVGRLICPVARFEEFAGHFGMLADGAGGKPWHISALGAGCDDAGGFADVLAGEVDAINQLTHRFDGKVVVDAFECRLPRALVESGDGAAVARLVAAAAGVFAGAAATVSPSYEIPFVGEWQRTVPATVAALARANAAGSPPGAAACGAKIRTGGVEAHMFPSPEQVACLVTACKESQLAFKATAGLHHPVRHFNDSVQTKMHGFFNVFGAAVLLDCGRIAPEQVVAMLNEEEAAAFRFDDDSFSWRQHRASCDEIRAARSGFATSFGSCSVDEPCDDLGALKLL